MAFLEVDPAAVADLLGEEDGVARVVALADTAVAQAPDPTAPVVETDPQTGELHVRLMVGDDDQLSVTLDRGLLRLAIQPPGLVVRDITMTVDADLELRSASVTDDVLDVILREPERAAQHIEISRPSPGDGPIVAV